MKFAATIRHHSRSIVKFFGKRLRGSAPASGGDSGSENPTEEKKTEVKNKDKKKADKKNDLTKDVIKKGTGFIRGVPMLSDEFQVRLKHTEIKGLSIDVAGPNYIRLHHKVKAYAFVKISYKVRVEGVYAFEITYRCAAVPGADTLVRVDDCKVKSLPIPLANLQAFAKGERGRYFGQAEVTSFSVDSLTSIGAGIYVYPHCPESRTIQECPIRHHTRTWTGWMVEFICPYRGVSFLSVKYDRLEAQLQAVQEDCDADLLSKNRILSLLVRFRRSNTAEMDERKRLLKQLGF